MVILSRFVAKGTLVIEGIMVFVFQVTLQDHLMKVLNDFIVRGSASYVTILPSLVAIDQRHYSVDIIV